MARRPLVGKEDVCVASDDVPIKLVDTHRSAATSKLQLPHQLAGTFTADVDAFQLAIVHLLDKAAIYGSVAILQNAYVDVNLLLHCLTLSGFWGFPSPLFTYNYTTNFKKCKTCF